MSKTPYEIRLEVLKMAQDIELHHYQSNCDAIMRNWETSVETARVRNETPPEMPEMPVFPTEQVIVSKAQFLGEFINNSDKKPI